MTPRTDPLYFGSAMVEFPDDKKTAEERDGRALSKPKKSPAKIPLRTRFSLIALGFAGGALVTIGGVCLALFLAFWVLTRTDTWHRDEKPNAKAREQLRQQGFPDSVYRIVEAGFSSAFNGDGDTLVNYCFSPADLPMVQKAIGGDRKWLPGLPQSGYPNIHQTAPRDLQFPPDIQPEEFLHLPLENDVFEWKIIDTNRGIAYHLVTRT